MLRAARSSAADPTALPDGAMFVLDGTAHLLWRGSAWPWSFASYGEPVPVPNGPATVLTSPPMLAVLRAGYTPLVHPSMPG